ncbi:hypothetical protein N7509_003810 [Penicillium cosmopolitanum]|uniref:Uncharacterized protein n=1 Tax=Penicillium cosmopolitanum TaxID=1131564 RepID=A0A9W9W5L1_9EURO|nr:uncharacterized protein N7509_003810 [Penicillium cosmopolitanum]KAJ5403939.1 hypothetical protein N7509_003810 [Penicillium cosmopolitanum]
MGRPLNLDDVESNQDQDQDQNRSHTWRDWMIVFTWSIVGYLALITTVIGYFDPSLLPVDPAALLFNKDISPFYAFSRGGHFSKPSGFKIVALVPFSNHEHTSILECYLQVKFESSQLPGKVMLNDSQKNLIHNHGFLDQVVFIPQTNDATSLRWLNSLVEETSEYAISPAGRDMDWKFAQDNVMYIRIDGDVVYMEDHTIPTIVKTKLDNPDTLMVSANVVNEGALASLHSHRGVSLPYLPELQHTPQPSRSKSQLEHDWRASSLPSWTGPADFKVRKDFKPPFEGHRWLLPRESATDRDPIAGSVYTDTGPSMSDWTVGAQQHYSFLHHLELDNLDRYKFPLWVNPTEPVTINFGCFWGLREVFGHKSSEEIYESWAGSDGTRPNVTIDGKGLVSHYSSRQGVEGLDSTDVLERYRAYAQERVCRPSQRQKKPRLEVD